MEFDWQPVDLRGRIYSWTVTERPPLPALEDEVPLTLVVVALAVGDPVRLIGRLDGVTRGDPRLRAEAPVVGEFDVATPEAPILVWSLEPETEIARVGNP
jgi:uncharacterized OB-fold protein